MMKLKDGALRFCSQAFFCMAELLVVSVSFIIFTVLDFLDRILCVVFWALDSILDPGSAPCYCKQRSNGVLPEARVPTLNPAQTVLSPMAVYNASDQPPHAKNAHGSPLQATLAADDTKQVEHAGRGTPSNERFFAAEFGQCNDGNFGYDHLPSDAFTIQHAHMVERNHQSRLPFKMQCSSLPSRIADIAGRNNLITSLQSNDDLSLRIMSRWSDCSCSTCTSWHADEQESIYVHVEGEGHDNVVFIHGFLSSSLIWSEKVIPHLSNTASATYRLFAVDLLGFGKSPKPRSCHYTMADHIKKIEECVLHRYKIGSFHLVAHSMGCLVALALAAAHVDSIKTITLVAPPYFPAPPNEAGASYVLRQVAPRRIWPLTAFGASVMSWYEHVGRGVCFVICKQHITWEYVISFLTLNRISRAAVRDFMQHTHHSAWHIFHNVICAEAHAMDGYLDKLHRVGCPIHVLHGKDDRVVPTCCSYQLRKRYPSLKLQVLDAANHFTIIYGREMLFSRMLEKIWRIEDVIAKSSRKV